MHKWVFFRLKKKLGKNLSKSGKEGGMGKRGKGWAAGWRERLEPPPPADSVQLATFAKRPNSTFWKVAQILSKVGNTTLEGNLIWDYNSVAVCIESKPELTKTLGTKSIWKVASGQFCRDPSSIVMDRANKWNFINLGKSQKALWILKRPPLSVLEQEEHGDRKMKIWGFLPLLIFLGNVEGYKIKRTNCRWRSLSSCQWWFSSSRMS